MDSFGTLNENGNVNGTALGIRPVINLRADTPLTGTGTSSDPYVATGAT